MPTEGRALPTPVERLLRKWGEPTSSEPVPAERFDQFTGVVPGLLLEFWRELGFAGFADGLWWICDPVAWQPAVDAWTEGLELEMGPDRWLAVARSAFGRLSLWGLRTGMSLDILPHRGMVFPSDCSAEMSTTSDRDAQVYAHFLCFDRSSLDVSDEDEQGLFEAVHRALGPVGPDSVYGFVPMLGLGGLARAEQVEIVAAGVHLDLLRQVTPRQIMRSDARG